MGLLKRWFGREETIEPTPHITITREITSTKREYLSQSCGLCNKEIGYEKRKKLGGRGFHKSCYKDQYRKLKAQGKAF